jgi:Protein of unknown function, DUF547
MDKRKKLHVLRFMFHVLCNTQHVLHFALVALSMTFVLTCSAHAAVDHRLWDTLLHRYVDQNGRVAYRDLRTRDYTSFAEYLKLLAEAKVEGMSETEEKAFWINAYNAIIIQGVLNGHTAESFLSRKRLFSWYAPSLAGKERTPDEVEHQILRKKFRDPRVHFALVCASTSCPKLRPEAYVPERLDQQLDDAAHTFVNDPLRNHIEAGHVAVSSIFQWFAQDFSEQAGTVPKFLLRFVAEEKKATLENLTGELLYLEYNWTLNAQDGQRVS